MPKIRKAELEDAERIVEINIDSWNETYKGIFPDDFLLSLDNKRESSIEKCKKSIDEYIVAIDEKDDNRVVGFARIGINKKKYSEKYGEIYSLYLDKGYKNQKIGTKIVNYCFLLLRDNYDYCLVSTLEENSANEFYRKIGGKLIGQCEFELQNRQYKENLYLYDLTK